jgi:hypothetical protein
MTTTTSKFQIKSDYYNSIEECNEAFHNKEQTNIRYRNFNQTHFTVGDEEQFQHYRCEKNGNVCDNEIALDSNIFCNNSLGCEDITYEGYKNLEATNVIETFRYLFNKFKKGIFVKILNNELKVFLPFSNVNFINEWSHNIKIDPKYEDLHNFIKYTNEMEGRPFYKNNINEYINTWYGNNALVRYEYPIKESDTNIPNIKNMLEELCTNRKLPDIEFFINRRDFPLLTKNGTEPYYNLWNSMEQPLVSHNYKKYVPILSMSKSDQFADILIPSHEDWGRVQVKENKYFYKSHINFDDDFNHDWNSKKPTAIFRGSSTGYGVTIETNNRLKIVNISNNTSPDEDGIPYLDAGITKWNTRPRKFLNSPYLQTIEVDKLPFGLSEKLSPKEQSNYKYIIHIDGHVSAFRLSYEFGMGSTILLVKSDWKMWYSHMLKEYVHYVPIKEDLSDIIEKIKWCRDNDKKCKDIADNAKIFYNTFLNKNGIFDYMQQTLIEIKKYTGNYLYNIVKPLDIQNDYEYDIIKTFKPKRKHYITLHEYSSIPNMGRCYGILKGIHLVLDKINKFEKYAAYKEEIFANKLGTVNKYDLLNFSFSVKTTEDENKIKEHIHETYIGISCINNILKQIPNFVYIFGMYKSKDKKRYNVITEYIKGQTLKDYISSDKFVFSEYISIVLQICLALHVAQKEICLVHNDLTPWNIIIQKFKEPVNIEYIINNKKVIRIKTNIIPIIIDYGKAHVINKNIHSGFINMFKFSSSADILSLLITSIYQISTDKHLERYDFNSLLKLANFMSKTKYCKEPFTNSKELKFFLYNAKKYSNLISDNKYELENKTPLNLFDYINKNLRYNLNIETINSYIPIMDKGYPEQILNYVLSKNVEERSNTYINSLIEIKNNVMLFEYANLISVYYIAQNIENVINSLYNDMNYFLNDECIESNEYNKKFIEIRECITNFFTKKINSTKEIEPYKIPKNLKDIKNITYNEDSFLQPEKIKQLIVKYNNNDITDYISVIDNIFLNKGLFKLTDSHRSYYSNSLQNVFNCDNILIKLYNANHNSLRHMIKHIYSINKKELELLEQKDEFILNRINVYNDIINSI